MVVALVAVGLSGCATWSNPDARSTGLDAGLDPALERFVSARAVPIWIPTGSPGAGGDISFQEMQAGQAALITEDGYALTAGHVVDAAAPAYTVHLKADPTKRVRAGRFFRGRVLLADADGAETAVPYSDLLMRPVRVVRRFDGVDVALIKTDFRPSETFPLASEPPHLGEMVAVALNPLKGRRETVAAGGVVGNGLFRRRADSWRAYARCVAAQGDSGGPVVTEDGELVGVTVGAVYFRRPWRLLTGEWFDFRMDGASRAAVEQAIAGDRVSGGRREEPSGA
ncbi:hypothetical protein BH23VER1_BH23VER1_35660 [soil metagenome]